MKKIIVVISVFVLLFMITGCVKKTGSGESKVTDRPLAEGETHAVENLEFFLPKQLKKAPNNGINGVYEFYTGEFKDSGPTGVDVKIIVSRVDEDVKLKDYATNDSVGAKKKIKLSKKKINNFEWYFGERETSYYYCGYYEGAVYDVEISQKSDPDDLFADLLKMFEETMYFDILEQK